MSRSKDYESLKQEYDALVAKKEGVTSEDLDRILELHNMLNGLLGSLSKSKDNYKHLANYYYEQHYDKLSKDYDDRIKDSVEYKLKKFISNIENDTKSLDFQKDIVIYSNCIQLEVYDKVYKKLVKDPEFIHPILGTIILENYGIKENQVSLLGELYNRILDVLPEECENHTKHLKRLFVQEDGKEETKEMHLARSLAQNVLVPTINTSDSCYMSNGNNLVALQAHWGINQLIDTLSVMTDLSKKLDLPLTEGLFDIAYSVTSAVYKGLINLTGSLIADAGYDIVYKLKEE